MSAIEWTDVTWNPVRGCSRVSEGCRNCYAERQAARFVGPGQPFRGFAQVTAPRDLLDRVGGRRNGWTGKVELIPEKLDEPLRWRKPRRVFVNSMSDLFHERLSDDAIDQVFAVMSFAPQHTFQVLTKRPERMLSYLNSVRGGPASRRFFTHAQSINLPGDGVKPPWLGWPLPNVWLGVSVEDQASFDDRVLPLVSTPATVRFISYEPAIGPIDFSLPVAPMATPLLRPTDPGNGIGCVHWLIVGGESGPSARPCHIAWIRAAVEQCRGAGVPVFVKQLGARPLFHSRPGERGAAPCDGACCRVFDRKGGNPVEWPEDLRVREFPHSGAAA